MDKNFLPLIRKLIKGKLTEMDVYVDEELIDYITVLLINKKNAKQMIEDLNLFLGDSAEAFVKWLFKTCEKIVNGTHDVLKESLAKKIDEKKREEHDKYQADKDSSHREKRQLSPTPPRHNHGLSFKEAHNSDYHSVSRRKRSERDIPLNDDTSHQHHQYNSNKRVKKDEDKSSHYKDSTTSSSRTAKKHYQHKSPKREYNRKTLHSNKNVNEKRSPSLDDSKKRKRRYSSTSHSKTRSPPTPNPVDYDELDQDIIAENTKDYMMVKEGHSTSSTKQFVKQQDEHKVDNVVTTVKQDEKRHETVLEEPKAKHEETDLHIDAIDVNHEPEDLNESLVQTKSIVQPRNQQPLKEIPKILQEKPLNVPSETAKIDGLKRIESSIKVADPMIKSDKKSARPTSQLFRKAMKDLDLRAQLKGDHAHKTVSYHQLSPTKQQLQHSQKPLNYEGSDSSSLRPTVPLTLEEIRNRRKKFSTPNNEQEIQDKNTSNIVSQKHISTNEHHSTLNTYEQNNTILNSKSPQEKVVFDYEPEKMSKKCVHKIPEAYMEDLTDPTIHYDGKPIEFTVTLNNNKIKGDYGNQNHSHSNLSHRLGNRQLQDGKVISNEYQRFGVAAINTTNRKIIINNDNDKINIETVHSNNNYRDGESMEVSENDNVKERCKFWPICKNGDACIFHHPTQPCKNFPNCAFGDKCLFIHPNCRFDAHCTKKDCPFTHASIRRELANTKLETINQPLHNNIKPMLDNSVKNTAPNSGMVKGPLSTVPCRFGGICHNLTCPYMHPPECKFGQGCVRVGCSFRHTGPNRIVVNNPQPLLANKTFLSSQSNVTSNNNIITSSSTSMHQVSNYSLVNNKTKYFAPQSYNLSNVTSKSGYHPIPPSSTRNKWINPNIQKEKSILPGTNNNRLTENVLAANIRTAVS